MSTPAVLDFAELEVEARAFWLRRDQEDRESEDPRRVHQTLAERNAIGPDLTPMHEGIPWGLMDDAFQRYGDTLAEDVGRYRHAFAQRDPSIIEASIRTALRKRNIPINPLSLDSRDAELAILKGTKEAHELMLRRQQDEDVPTPKPTVIPDRGPRLTEALALWKSGSPARDSESQVQTQHAKPTTPSAASSNSMLTLVSAISPGRGCAS